MVSIQDRVVSSSWACCCALVAIKACHMFAQMARGSMADVDGSESFERETGDCYLACCCSDWRLRFGVLRT
jgi:hypothetical protein